MKRPHGQKQSAAKNVVRAQYVAGSVDGIERVGYRQEYRVNPQSMTECYVALRLFVNTWRWQGVPFYMRSGKRLARRVSEIAIQFKQYLGQSAKRPEFVSIDVRSVVFGESICKERLIALAKQDDRSKSPRFALPIPRSLCLLQPQSEQRTR